jgi:hypothetical protein
MNTSYRYFDFSINFCCLKFLSNLLLGPQKTDTGPYLEFSFLSLHKLSPFSTRSDQAPMLLGGPQSSQAWLRPLPVCSPNLCVYFHNVSWRSVTPLYLLLFPSALHVPDFATLSRCHHHLSPAFGPSWFSLVQMAFWCNFLLPPCAWEELLESFFAGVLADSICWVVPTPYLLSTTLSGGPVGMGV